MKHISLCLTNYNRLEFLLNSFAKVENDPRISEIVISDDCSDMYIWNQLTHELKDHSKVKLFRNDKNVDCYVNKKLSIERATNDYVIILDSDNQIDTDYLDAIYAEEWNPKLILAPSYAKPTFDYRHLEGIYITKGNISFIYDEPMLPTALNTMNYFVNRQEYLDCWDGSVDPVTADSIYQNYNFLKNGGEIKIVPNMHYLHAVHNGSHYVNNVHRTGDFYNFVEQQIRNLK